MNFCPITYEECGESLYSLKGLHLLSSKLNEFKLFPYTAEEQINEAISRSAKMSIQGVQPKLSVRLNIKESSFVIVDKGGTFILKPQNMLYKELPQNEDLTMRLAKIIGLEVPLHGMIYSKDKSLTYFIKRFDRIGRNRKLAVEDFAQLAGESRETKYNYSMERLVNIINEFCTFPEIEKVKLFKLMIFNYIIGNEDMHLKNYSLITRSQKIELSPCYDLINTTISLKNVTEEIALPLNGKKNNLNRRDLINYYSRERLRLSEKIIDDVLKSFIVSFSVWETFIGRSFLSNDMKKKYIELINRRRKVLSI